MMNDDDSKIDKVLSNRKLIYSYYFVKLHLFLFYKLHSAFNLSKFCKN